MTKPIWELEAAAISDELLRPPKRTPSATEVAAIARRLDALPASPLEEADEALAEFGVPEATVFDGGAMGTEITHPRFHDEEAQPTRPAFVRLATANEDAFVTPTSKLAPHELAELRQQLASSAKK
ncbi:MAG: hypothetical protein IPL79_15560 [Myxococcales bacterium]|nr:hypothetical protein [Myxococcales bacterium]